MRADVDRWAMALRRMWGGDSSNPKEIKKSFEVLSPPLPSCTDPKGKGAGTNPQFPLRILSASTQYLSPFTLPLSILPAASLKISAAFLKASSLLPTASCALNAWTEGMGGGLETSVVDRVEEGREEIGDGWFGCARRSERSSLA